MSSAETEPYKWIVVCTAIASCAAAYGIGGNAFSAAWGPSVGAKVITFRWALAIGVLCEFIGVVLLSPRIVSMTAVEVVHWQPWVACPEALMYTQLVAALCAMAWLLLNTQLRLSGSLLHAEIGAYIGSALVAVGARSVVWGTSGVTSFPYVAGLSKIVLSMLMLPVEAILVAGLMYLGLRSRVLRDANSFHRMLWAFPFLVCLVTVFGVAVVLFVVPHFLDSWGLAWDPKLITMIVAAAGMVAAAAAVGMALRLRQGGEYQALQRAPVQLYDNFGLDPQTVLDLTSDAARGDNSIGGNLRQATLSRLQRNVHLELTTNKRLAAMHASAEVFDEATEDCCKWPQLLLAAVLSLTHGATVGRQCVTPLASCLSIYLTGTVTASVSVPHWISVLMAVSLAAGCLTFSYNMTATLGVHFAKLTPSRALAVSVASAVARLTALRGNLPDTGMQVAVCGICAVGGVEGMWQFNGRELRRHAAVWAATVPLLGLAGAAAFAQSAYGPSITALRQQEAVDAAAKAAVLMLANATHNSTAVALAANFSFTRYTNASQAGGQLLLNVAGQAAATIFALRGNASTSGGAA